jgi:hypothetical protein
MSHSCGLLALRCNRSRQPKTRILLSYTRTILEIRRRHHSTWPLSGSALDHCKRNHRRQIAHPLHYTKPCVFRLLLLVLRGLRPPACRLFLVRYQHLQRSLMRICCPCGNMAFVRLRSKSPSRKCQHHDADANRYECLCNPSFADR